MALLATGTWYTRLGANTVHNGVFVVEKVVNKLLNQSCGHSHFKASPTALIFSSSSKSKSCQRRDNLSINLWRQYRRTITCNVLASASGKQSKHIFNARCCPITNASRWASIRASISSRSSQETSASINQ